MATKTAPQAAPNRGAVVPTIQQSSRGNPQKEPTYQLSQIAEQLNESIENLAEWVRLGHLDLSADVKDMDTHQFTDADLQEFQRINAMPSCYRLTKGITRQEAEAFSNSYDDTVNSLLNATM